MRVNGYRSTVRVSFVKRGCSVSKRLTVKLSRRREVVG